MCNEDEYMLIMLGSLKLLRAIHSAT